MFILFPLVFTRFPYIIEVQYGFMTVFLLGGIISIRPSTKSQKTKEKVIGLVQYDIC